MYVCIRSHFNGPHYVCICYSFWRRIVGDVWKLTKTYRFSHATQHNVFKSIFTLLSSEFQCFGCVGLARHLAEHAYRREQNKPKKYSVRTTYVYAFPIHASNIEYTIYIVREPTKYIATGVPNWCGTVVGISYRSEYKEYMMQFKFSITKVHDAGTSRSTAKYPNFRMNNNLTMSLRVQCGIAIKNSIRIDRFGSSHLIINPTRDISSISSIFDVEKKWFNRSRQW